MSAPKPHEPIDLKTLDGLSDENLDQRIDYFLRNASAASPHFAAGVWLQIMALLDLRSKRRAAASEQRMLSMTATMTRLTCFVSIATAVQLGLAIWLAVK